MFKPVKPHPDFPKLEEEILEFWEKEKIFEKSLARTKKGKPFTFYDGPPFATGLPHYGHILASTIKDLIPRYQTMKGRFVRRRWGWDCHGLPIEEIVERTLKISGKKEIEKIGIKKFNETCRSMVLQYAREWGKMVRRIARWVEFDDAYRTMDREYMESVWWAFKDIYKKGLVYEGRKVLLYCPRCETPVSNFEVAMDNSYQEVTEEAVTVKFKIINNRLSIIDNNYPTYLLSWTTTPWTLPGNVALAVGKEIEYVIFKLKTQNSKLKIASQNAKLENYIVAKERLFSVIASGAKQSQKIAASPSAPRNDIEVVKTLKGKDLIGLEYEPLYKVAAVTENPKAHRVYAANFVNTEEGTGIVHTAVVYGEADYELGLREGLPVVPLLDEKGKFNEQAPPLVRGREFKAAEAAIKEDLQKRRLLFARGAHRHSYPHCWRCGQMLFYNAIPAWFINIQKMKKQLLQSNRREINWYPGHLKLGRYAKSVESAPDWNISRNRYWGNPIPVWRCVSCKKDTIIGSVPELKARAVDRQKSVIDEKFDLHRPYIDDILVQCEHCSGEAKRITEIFDSWMEAASMPFAEYHYPFENKKVFNSRFPAQFVAEYIAQTRAWFYVMHVMSLILFTKAPFENVVTTGTILNEKGEKLSKSRRNFPDPWEIINKYGVDSLRFYLMNSVVMQSDNLFFSERDLQTVYRKVILILWNVYNYFITYANEAKWQHNAKLKGKPTSTNRLDQWIRARLKWLTGAVGKKLDEYDTVLPTREIERFVNDLSTWYLRRSRGRKDNDFFSTLHHVLVELSKITAPIMPYTSELIYRNLTGEESVHLADWPEAKKLSSKETESLQQMDALRKEIEEVHAIRAKEGIKLRQPLASVGSVIGIRDDALIEIYKSEANVKEVKFGNKLVIDPVITPELKIEGLSRELERQINQFRKETGLKIGELVDLFYQTDSAMLEKAMSMVDRKKIYVRRVASRSSPVADSDYEKELEIEGEKIKLLIDLITN